MPDRDPLFSADYVPPARAEREPREPLAPRPNASTRAVWLIVWSPVFHLVLHIVTGIPTWAGIILVAITVLLGNLLLARWDRKVLISRGFDDAPNANWALLTPIVYLLLRANRVYRRVGTGYRPFWSYLAVLALTILAVDALRFWLGVLVAADLVTL
jgi:hypothetical protein